MVAASDDVLLQDVRETFASLAKEHLLPSLRALKEEAALSPVHKTKVETIIRQLLRLQWRSHDVLSEFAGFYCVRLLLDEQSPLATYFIDLFCQLEWLLEELSAAFSEIPKTLLRFPDETVLLPLLRLVRPVAGTCRLLYVAYMILPRSESVQDLEEQHKFWRDEVKRKGMQGRQFSRNPMHCRIRELGFTNLDQPGKSMIKLMEQLGEGQYGTVYKGVFEADHGKDRNSKTIIGTPVAVKMFPSSINVDGGGSNSDFGFRLLQNMDQEQDNRVDMEHDNVGLREELHRLVSVKHPNIVTPIGYIGKRTEGDCGLVMELMAVSLYDYLKEPLQELDMLDLMLEIAKGMQFLHENNLIHRDLKPGNVLLRVLANPDLGFELVEVKLADFGITKLRDFDEGGTVSMHTASKGTSFYMAPEIQGDRTREELPYSEKVDVFSFGTTCFNILKGSPDAPCTSAKKFYEDVRTGKWKEWMQGIDKHLHYLVKLIGKCWESDPAMRPTFATICLLLRHAMQCHVSAQSLRDALGASQATSNLQVFKKNCKLQHARIYSPIIFDYLQGQDSVIGLRVVTKCLVDFKSVGADKMSYFPSFLRMAPIVAVAKRILSSGLFCNEGDAAESSDIDNSSVMKAIYWAEAGFTTGLASAAPSLTSSWELMDSCLEKPDPLIFMKGLPCHNLAERYCQNNRVVYCDEIIKLPVYSGEFKLPPLYEEPEFDFTNDEACSELVVDTSLIPLLVAFWTKPY